MELTPHEREEAQKASIDEARALHALSCLKNLLSVARPQIDLVTWREKGGFDAEELVDSLEHGLLHPALRKWQKRKSANRLAPTKRDLHLRRLVASLCICLERIGLSKREAHRRTAKRLRLVLPRVTINSIDHWARNNRALDKVVESALRSCDRTPEKIVEYFVGLIGFHCDPYTQAIRDGDEVVIRPSGYGVEGRPR